MPNWILQRPLQGATILLLILLVSLPSSVSLAQDNADRQALQALKPVYEQFAREGNPALLKPHLDPEFTGVMVTGESVTGYDGVEKYWQYIWDLMGEGGQYTVTVTEDGPALFAGDLAIASGTTEDKVVTSVGKEFHFASRWTTIFRKREGEWKILRIHASMNPISNEFIAAQVTTVMMITGSIAAAVSLILGWLAHMFWRSRRKPPADA